MFADDLWRLARWDPWRELGRIENEVNRLVAGGLDTEGNPPLNVSTTETAAFVSAELPGLSAQDIDIAVNGDTLTLSGKREPEAGVDGATFHRRERSFGAFSRQVQLPFRIDADKVTAEFHSGVLELSLPRAREDMPRKIPVQSN